MKKTMMAGMLRIGSECLARQALLALMSGAAIALSASSALADPPGAQNPIAGAPTAAPVVVPATPAAFTSLEEWQKALWQSASASPDLAVSPFIASPASQKSFLTFHASKIFQGNPPRVLLYLRTDPACGKCIGGVIELRAAMEQIAEMRGLVPVWVTREELGDTAVEMSEMEERMIELARLRSEAAIWVVETSKRTEVSMAEADEYPYLIRSHARVRTAHELKHSLAHPIRDEASLSSKMHLLAAETFGRFGEQMLVEQNLEGDSVPEVALIMPGISEFPRFARIKEKLRAGLSHLGVVLERKLSRDQIVFVVETAQDVSEVKRALQGLSSREEPIRVGDAGDRALQVMFVE